MGEVRGGLGWEVGVALCGEWDLRDYLHRVVLELYTTVACSHSIPRSSRVLVLQRTGTQDH